MVDLQMLKSAIDKLDLVELNEIYRHVQTRRRVWWVVPAENIAKLESVLSEVHAEAASMTEEEIDTIINQAIAEVRLEQAHSRI